MKKKRGQVSIEYMIVVGFAFIMIMPVIIIFLVQSNDIQDSINVNQANSVARKIAHYSDSIYYMGHPSKTTIKAYIPKGIESISIGNQEVVFRMQTSHGPTDVVHITDVNITGTLKTSSGIRNIEIQAMPGYVNVTDR